MNDDMRETLDAIEGLAHALKHDLQGSGGMDRDFEKCFHVPDWTKFNEHLNELKQWVAAIDDYKPCRHGHDSAPTDLGLFGHSIEYMRNHHGAE